MLLLVLIGIRAEYDYCIIPDDFEGQCPTGSKKINSISLINESEIQSETISLYIINNESTSYEINFRLFEKTSFDIKGIGSSFLKILDIKENMTLNFEEIILESSVTNWDLRYLTFRQVHLPSHDISLKCDTLDSDFSSISNLSSILISDSIFYLTNESFYPTSDIHINLTNTTKTYYIYGFAHDTNLCFGPISDTLTFPNIPYTITIFKTPTRDNRVGLFLTNPVGHVNVSDPSTYFISLIPYLTVYMYENSEFTIPNYITPITREMFYFIIEGNSTLNVNENGQYSTIEVSEATLNINLVSLNSRIRTFSSIFNSYIYVYTTLQTTSKLSLSIDTSFISAAKPRFEMECQNENISITFTEIGFDADEENTEILFSGKANYIITNTIELYSGFVHFHNLHFGRMFQLDFVFTLDIMGSIRVDKTSFISQYPKIEIITSYFDDYIPSDELVEPFLTKPFNILDLNGYKGNIEFNIHYPQFANVYGFCIDLSLMNTTYDKESGIVSFKMIDYPSIVETKILYGDYHTKDGYKLFNENNFTNWKNRFRDFTKKLFVHLDKSMNNNLFFDLNEKKGDDFVVVASSYNNYQLNIDAEDLGNKNSLFDIELNNVVLQIKNEKVGIKPNIKKVALYNNSIIHKSVAEKVDFSNVNIELDIDSLQNFELANSMNTDLILIDLHSNTTKIEFNSNNWVVYDDGVKKAQISNINNYNLQKASALEILCHGNTYNNVDIDALGSYFNLKISGDWSKYDKQAVTMENKNMKTFDIDLYGNIVPISLNNNYKGLNINLRQQKEGITEVYFPSNLSFFDGSTSFYISNTSYPITNVYFDNISINATKSDVGHDEFNFMGSNYSVKRIEIDSGSTALITNINVTESVVLKSNSFGVFLFSDFHNTSVTIYFSQEGVGSMYFENESSLPQSFDIYGESYKTSSDLPFVFGFSKATCSEILKVSTLHNDRVLVDNVTKSVKLECSTGSLYLVVIDDKKKEGISNVTLILIIVFSLIAVMLIAIAISYRFAKKKRFLREFSDREMKSASLLEATSFTN
ncbi:hypothetical protein GPJ56_009266 [Histomonas meleagridis]|uniref:uncharacterized protein n=1 Tax=Histomonas meleagridis TaxID=135588 RepID=UPI0035595CB8|nr:hypothetical protein GPJ56_009266 [Histomonas meleagridis]KAH0801637.1 hypothetical protein GO595_005636 [Histomonas meleagridis]